jgi:hypothetical protein
MTIIPCVRIDARARGRGHSRTGFVYVSPYAAVVKFDDEAEPRSVTDYFVPRATLDSEILRLRVGAPVRRDDAEAIAAGWEELFGTAAGVVTSVTGVAVISQDTADAALRRRVYFETR